MPCTATSAVQQNAACCGSSPFSQLLAGILINPAGVQSQVSGINLQPTVGAALPVARPVQH